MGNTNKFEIHYYFDDELKHSMNALVKAKADLDILSVIEELSKIFDIPLSVETQALEEGGLRQYLVFSDNLKTVGAIIAFLFTVYIYADGSELRELEKQEKRLSIEEKELNIKKLRQELSMIQNEEDATNLASKLLFVSPKIIAKRTSYFKNIQQQNDLSKVGYSVVDSNEISIFPEKIIERKNFRNMIIEPRNPEPDLYENVEIEIVSPILKKHNKSKWRGIFNNENIQFTVNDKSFRDSVFLGEISFTSNTILVCDLEVLKKINEIGEEVIASYKVTYVYEYTNDGVNRDMEVESRIKKKIKRNLNQGDLFA
ncbi:hypothetical protein [Acinetobacter faecalis]|uniref:hypothetical protein n=1 Tax=Acinetobacter faecalis TaxID=2665161 RepID=UPI002A9184BE|nr:hypothetical protein [Acinetobacter faecalis]MDY6450231.1 hypothetical protein [Acinetobacter faecalis]